MTTVFGSRSWGGSIVRAARSLFRHAKYDSIHLHTALQQVFDNSRLRHTLDGTVRDLIRVAVTATTLEGDLRLIRSYPQRRRLDYDAPVGEDGLARSLGALVWEL